MITATSPYMYIVVLNCLDCGRKLQQRKQEVRYTAPESVSKTSMVKYDENGV